jgi:hypothetical protein
VTTNEHEEDEMADPKPSRRQSSRTSGRSTPSGGKQSASGLEALQRELVSAQADYATTATEAFSALNNRTVETQRELVETIRGLWVEVFAGREAAAQAYPDRVQAALSDTEAADRVTNALQTYVDGLREFAAARSDAEQAARESYQEYAAALQRGEPEDEVRAHAEKAQQAYLDALRTSSPSGDLYRRVAEAGAACEGVVRETQGATVQAIAEAMREYVASPQATLEQGDVPQRYEEAVRRHDQQLSELVTSTQCTLVDAQVRALRELRAGWAKVAKSAVGSGDGAAGASSGNVSDAG